MTVLRCCFGRLLTRSVREREGRSKASDTTSKQFHVKKVRRLFLLSMMLFCTDDRCSVPFHTMLTDMVDSQGGSDLLIKILNQLGVCSSYDTFSRYMMYKVTSCQNVQNAQSADQDAFTVISADNIDYVHHFAQTSKGDRNNSWHGTSIQAVQPLPSLSLIEEPSQYFSMCPPSHSDVTAQTVGGVCPQSHGDVTAQTVGSVYPQSHGDVTAQTVGSVYPQSHGDVTAQTVGSVYPQSHGDVTAQTVGSVYPQSHGDVTAQTVGSVYPQSHGDVTAQTVGSVYPQSHGDVTAQTVGGVYPQSHGDVTAQTVGGVYPQSHGDVTAQTVGGVYPQSHGDVTAQTVGSVYPQSHGDVTAPTVGGVYSQSHNDVTAQFQEVFLDSSQCNTISRGECTAYVHVTGQESQGRHSIAPNDPETILNLFLSRNDHSSPFSSPNRLTQSPARKKMRRARTGREKQLPLTLKSSQPFMDKRLMMTGNESYCSDDFLINSQETKILFEFSSKSNTYMFLKHFTSIPNLQKPLIGLQDFLSCQEVTYTEKSEVIYLDVMDAVADNKDTLMEMLSNLHDLYIVRGGRSNLVIEGDAKVFELIQSLKFEYGTELKWVKPYPGDWHLLKNYQMPLMKAYFDAGLKDLANAAGYPVSAIQCCGNLNVHITSY